MDSDTEGRADDGRRRHGHLARLIATAGATAAMAGALFATGAVSYVAEAFGSPAGQGSASSQYRPGWGCGDRNHDHTGPPGNQYAPPPPGCR